MTEPPEHRACRTNTNPERRGVEAALNEWRLGDSNWRNVYIGTRHVGVFWVRGLPEQVIAAMNGNPESDERLRVEGRRQADSAILWDTTCVGCAARMDALAAECLPRASDVVWDVAARLRAAYDATGNLEALRVAELVEEYAVAPAQRNAQLTEGPTEGAGEPRPASDAHGGPGGDHPPG